MSEEALFLMSRSHTYHEHGERRHKLDRRDDEGIKLIADILNEKIKGRNERGLETTVNEFLVEEMILRRRIATHAGPCERGCPDLRGEVLKVLKSDHRGGWKSYQ